ncbi:hypothetical protein EDC01DRAFT_635323 [Geopyxis carbonaria]|nr:hypothetical protein EDC01DRAFT_635323 [Geopyxis carbonaria]
MKTFRNLRDSLAANKPGQGASARLSGPPREPPPPPPIVNRWSAVPAAPTAAAPATRTTTTAKTAAAEAAPRRGVLRPRAPVPPFVPAKYEVLVPLAPEPPKPKGWCARLRRYVATHGRYRPPHERAPVPWWQNAAIVHRPRETWPGPD